MRSHHGLVGLLVAVTAIACSATTYVESNADAGADAEPDSAALDVSAVDVAVDASTTDAGPPDTGPACPLLDLLEGRGAMESLTAWSVAQGTIDSAVGAGVTGNALQFCQVNAGARPQVYLLKDRGIQQPSGNYYLKASMRRKPGGGRPNILGMSLYGYAPPGIASVGGTGNLFIENAWACFDLSVTVGEYSPGVRYTSAAPGFGGEYTEPGVAYPQCLLIDDVVVYKVPDDGIVPAACRCK
jgi:hypothetical protein